MAAFSQCNREAPETSFLKISSSKKSRMMFFVQMSIREFSECEFQHNSIICKNIVSIVKCLPWKNRFSLKT